MSSLSSSSELLSLLLASSASVVPSSLTCSKCVIYTMFSLVDAKGASRGEFRRSIRRLPEAERSLGDLLLGGSLGEPLASLGDVLLPAAPSPGMALKLGGVGRLLLWTLLHVNAFLAFNTYPTRSSAACNWACLPTLRCCWVLCLSRSHSSHFWSILSCCLCLLSEHSLEREE